MAEPEAELLRSHLRNLGPTNFIQQFLRPEKYSISQLCAAFRVQIPPFADAEDSLNILGIAMFRELARRQRLQSINDIDDVVSLLKTRKNVMVITGAGVCLPFAIAFSG